jgi:hypothetical protein
VQDTLDQDEQVTDDRGTAEGSRHAPEQRSEGGATNSPRLVSAEPLLRHILTETTYDCILAGAGIRLIPDNTALFETLMNVIHRTAPDATLCFNTHPGDSVAAAQRWFP